MKKFVFCSLSFLCLIGATKLYGQQSQAISSRVSNIVLDSLLSPHENFEYAIKRIYKDIQGREHNLDFKAFRYAYIGYQNLKLQHKLNDKRLLSIIDFNKDSGKKRFYTIDLDSRQILYYTYVAHGKKTGTSSSSYFSNESESHKSSLGFYVTGKTYNGDAGFSL